MSADKRNPFASAIDFMGGIRTSFEISRDTERPAVDRPVRVSFSVGTGRGNSKPDMEENEFNRLASFLSGDLAITLTLSEAINAHNLGPAEIAARTLVLDESVEFKVSNEKGARTVKVPRNQWGEFCDFMQTAAGVIESERDLIWPVEAAPEPVPAGADVHVEDENA
jgi:hypothetical protein